jgi:hypothetical protein
MSRTLRSRITYANVMSTLAVFIALGGGAWAVSGRNAASTTRHRVSAGRQTATVDSQAASAANVSPGNDLIRACVNNRTQVARIIGAGPCPHGQHFVGWVNFNGHFESPHKEFSIDVKDNGVVLTSNARAGTGQISINPGGVLIKSEGNLILHTRAASLKTDKDMTTHVGRDQTTTVERNDTSNIQNDQTDSILGNLTTAVHKNRTTAIDQNDNTSVHKNELNSVDKSQTLTIGVNRSLTVGAASTETVGTAMAETVGGSLTTSIGGNQNLTISGNSNTKAIGGTLDTTAGTITNNADVITNASDGSLVNSAGTSLTNHADGALLNSAGAGLTNKAAKNLLNQAGQDLTNKAAHDLTSQAGGSLLDKAALNLTAQASGTAILEAPVTHVGCGAGGPAARMGDAVSVPSPPNGQISGGSSTVFVC